MSNPSGRRIGFGIQTPQEGTDYQSIKAHWLEAEKLGYDSCWLDDHLFPTPSVLGWREPQGEAYVWLGGLAEATTTLRFGVLVTCNSYRNPALLAKMAASIDHASNGRLEFGIGGGWHEQEYRAFGYDFPSAGVRLAQLEEGVQIYLKMMTEPLPNFEGKYFHIKDCVNNPAPVQKPYPPIWIGGGGEKKTLRVVAKYANKWNTGAPFSEIPHKMDVLREHCRDVGRDFNEIEKTWFGQMIIGEDEAGVNDRVERRAKGIGVTAEQYRDKYITGTPEQVVERLNQYIDAGITYFIAMFGKVSDLRATRLFAEKVIPAFR